jgi:hypothetical protein
MTTVYVLAALIVAAAAFFAILYLPNPVRVMPQRPEPAGGMMTWKVDFRLLFRARRNGHIVQHVRIRKRVATCVDAAFAAPLIDERTEFWEAWPVQAGTSIPWDRLGPVPVARDFDDAFVIRVPFGDLPFGRGRIRFDVRAQLRFYAGVTLPLSFIANNPNTQAGQALSDAAAPPFWRPGGTRHDLTAAWDNCTNEEHWAIDEHPKFRE